MLDEPRTDESSMPDLNGMSRTFDFHEMGLFLEIECPKSAHVTVIPCTKPPDPNLNPVVEINKIEPGRSLTFDTGEDLNMARVIFLRKRRRNGTDQWWECRWNIC
jgi:hypothetical protein